MIGVRFKTRPIDIAHFRVIFKPMCDFCSVFAMALHTNMKRFDASQCQKAIHRSRGRPARILNKCQTILEIFTRGTQNTHHHVAMAVDILCSGMHYDISAHFRRILQIGRSEGVVDHHDAAKLMSNLNHELNINDAQQRVCRRFHPYHFGFRIHHGADGRFIAHVNKMKLDSVISKNLGKQAISSAI